MKSKSFDCLEKGRTELSALNHDLLAKEEELTEKTKGFEKEKAAIQEKVLEYEDVSF